MPIAHGGLGVRRVSSLGIPAFLASAASTLPLQDDIISLCLCPTDSSLEQYLSMWSSSAGPPPDPLPRKQSFWDRPGLQTDRARIESSLVEPSQRARFLATQARHSGDWLLALPIANRGLRLDDEAVRVAVGMRLGLSLCVPHNCHCGTLVDAQGLHAMVCKEGTRQNRKTPCFLMTVVFIATAAAIYSLEHGLCTFPEVLSSEILDPIHQPSTLRGTVK